MNLTWTEKPLRKGQTMSDVLATIGAPLISAASALIVSAIQNHKTMGLIEYRLKELEKKVDKHNSVIERTFQLESDVKVINQRLDDMEK